ncbi:MAG: deoxyribodipyrimidine photolyase [Synergistales bacterium]|nr:deoxyribodipyrimidine photolyase [Synergistales bacterium]
MSWEGSRVDQGRIRELQEGVTGAGPVIYWMSRDQRARDNWALLHAQDLALEMGRALEVVFCLTEDFSGSSVRHHDFMLKGLEETAMDLVKLNISFKINLGNPGEEILRHATRTDPYAIVADFSPLRHHRGWLGRLTSQDRHRIIQVDAHNVIPCWLASEKREYAARTIRPKIRRMVDRFMSPFPEPVHHPHGTATTDPIPTAMDLNLDRYPSPLALEPGSDAGERKLKFFISQRLKDYGERRNDPNLDWTSGLSPYFHFGQIAPQRAIQVALEANLPGTDPFVEEALIRRELSDNYCYYERDYDSYMGLPGWARETLDLHRGDKRPWVYGLDTLEAGETHDDLWNSIQRSLVDRGRIHGYLRMYWGKMILQWSASPEEAFKNALHLNDRYALDGRDPNGYVGVAWCMGLHDRPWPRRPVFGTVRSMSRTGCERKFNVASYLASQ